MTSRKPSSIFDIPFWGYFKKLHDEFHIVLSCYCFFCNDKFSLSCCTTSYKEEFEENADWLRFGFHGFSGRENFELQDVGLSLWQYITTMSSLERIVGKRSLDYFPRLHGFAANKDLINSMVCAQYPLLGLLAADDGRVSYGLNSKENIMLQCQGWLKLSNVLILKTTQRLENLSIRCVLRYFSPPHTPHTPPHTYTVNSIVLFFTHEWIFYPKSVKVKVKRYLVQMLLRIICAFYFKRGYRFGFPMDLLN